MAAVSKEDYLKRYMSKEERSKSDRKKKKRKHTSTKESKLKIIDDDLDFKKRKSDDVALDDGVNDEAPTVAEFIDERPKHVRQLEEYRKNSRWKLLGKGEEDETSALDYGVIPQTRKGHQGSHSESDSVPSKRRHDTSDSDSSPRRTSSKSGSYSHADRKPQRHDSDSGASLTDKHSKVDRKKDFSPDNSPPKKRLQKTSKRHDSDSDVSLPRQYQGRGQNAKSSSSLSQKSTKPYRKSAAGSDSDNSSQRKSRRRVSDSDSGKSPPRKSKREYTDSDLLPPRKLAADKDQSPPRRKNKPRDSDSDHSPPRKSAASFDQSPRGRKKKPSGSDSDQSPPRKSAAGSDQSPPRRKTKPVDSYPDHSPPRKSAASSNQSPSRKSAASSNQSPSRKSAASSNQSPPRRRTKYADSDSDHSPPRKSAVDAESDQSPPRRRHDSDSSDQSPPRKKQTKSNSQHSRFDSDHQEDRQVKATKTLAGAKAGLSSAKEMRDEARKLQEKEERSFQSIGDEKLGKNARTVVRDKETGKKRDLRAEEAKNDEEEKRKEEQLKKYQQWGKGLKQQAIKESRLQDQVHEASKPLARFKDDKDLDDMLRREERMEDPMLDFIRKKKDKDDKKSGKKKKKELPSYKGPVPPPNRYNIQPGYRWDGVDRSNGFEKKIYASQASKKATQEMAYKWSTEDM